MRISGEQQDQRRRLQVSERCKESKHRGLVEPLGVIHRQRYRLFFCGCSEYFAQRSAVGHCAPIRPKRRKPISPFGYCLSEHRQGTGRSGRETSGLEQPASGESQNSTPILSLVSFDRAHRGDCNAVEPEPAKKLFKQTSFPCPALTFENESTGAVLAAGLGGSLRQTRQLDFATYQRQSGLCLGELG